MSKKRRSADRRARSVAKIRSNDNKTLVKIGAIVGVLLLVTVGFGAYVSRKVATTSASMMRSAPPPPTPQYSANAPAKEYLYAGSKLLAVSEPVQPAPNDLAVWRMSTGRWYVAGSDGVFTELTWGVSSDKPAPGDYDGDGKTDFCIYRPIENGVTGRWYVVKSSTNTQDQVYEFGEQNDIPVPADYDGDSVTDLAVYRPSTKTWWIKYMASGNIGEKQFGETTDKPIPSDFDGDGKADLALWRNGDATWQIWQSGSSTETSFQWGSSGDIPVPGDYDGDLKTDFAVWKSDSTWSIRQSSTGTTMPVSAWGEKGSDIAVQGDYDSDGKTDKAVWRPSTGTWYIIKSSNGNVRTAVWGEAGDIPVPAPYRR